MKDIVDNLASVLKSNSNIKTLIVKGKSWTWHSRQYVIKTKANGQAGTNLDALWIEDEVEVGFLESYLKINSYVSIFVFRLENWVVE